MTTSGGPSTTRRGRPSAGGRAAIVAATRDLPGERGISRLTTREVSLRAGVSEGSVFYHFTDRLGLLTAVIEDSLSALRTVAGEDLDGDSLAAVLEAFTASVETFLDGALPVMIAAQSDADLRAALIDYLVNNDMGPHRGVRLLAAYVRGAQAAGTVRGDVEAEAVAFLLYSASFERTGQRQLLGGAYRDDMPSRQTVVATMGVLLAPPSG